MPTPPPLSNTLFTPEDRTPTPAAGKALDGKAFALVAASIALVAAGIAIRNVAYQQTMRQTIQSMVNVGDQIWIGLPKELIQINSASQEVQRVPYSRMQLPSPISYAVKTRSNYWVQLFSGQVWRCDMASLPCQQVTTLGDGVNHYYNIAVLPEKNQIVAVNNFSAQIMTLDAGSGQIISANIAYTAPRLDRDVANQLLLKTAGSMDGWREGKLYRPNRLHVINDMLVQTDTGNQRVIAWPLDAEGMPLWQSPIDIIKQAGNQPYDVARIARQDPQNDQWLFLEAGVVLGHGKLVSYPASNGTQGTPIPIGIDDPTLMTQYDAHSVLIADPSKHHILHVDFSPYSVAAPGVMDYEIAGLETPLKELKHTNDLYQLLAKLTLLFFLAPLIAIFILYLRGYDLNQKLGKS